MICGGGARHVEKTLTQAQAQLVGVRAVVAAMPMPAPAAESDVPKCPHCGIVFRGPTKLAEHVYTQHGGPEPAHWVAAEARVAEPVATIEPTEGAE